MFIVFIMSIVFLVIAVMVGASHRNWKAVAEQNKQIAENAQRLLTAAKESQTKKQQQLQAEAVSRQQQISNLFTQVQVEKQSRDAKEKELAEQLVISQERLNRMELASRRVTEQDASIRQLQEDRKNLIDEVSLKRSEAVALQTQIFELKSTLELLEVTTSDLNEQLAKKTKIMKARGLNDESLTDEIEPKVEGIVMKVQDDLIVVSLGTDDGLRTGHTLDLFRGDKFIGKAIVSKAEFNMSAARVVTEFRQAVVREGDHVTTKL
jgi:vacuolar-type H+-ATPase subunit I/STV1